MTSRVRARINIATYSLAPRDAVSNDVFGMASILAAAGYTVNVFAAGVDAACQGRAMLLNSVPKDHWRARDILIYHHSRSWPQGEELLAWTRNRLVIRYHNITPAHYFEPYSKPHYEAVCSGQESTRMLARIPGAWFWGDSNYNSSELIAGGAPAGRCRSMAPLHGIDELVAAPPDWLALEPLKDHAVNVLFVGGFKPNKAHARLIRVFAAYHYGLNPNSRLILAGSFEPAFQTYLAELERLAEGLGVARRVLLRRAVSPTALRAYYTAAHVFLCMSEHEGFCVPLVEAMVFRVPIVAWARTAVAETGAGCSLLWKEYDESLFAESIHACADDPELARELRRLAWQRYQTEFTAATLRQRLLALLAEVEEN